VIGRYKERELEYQELNKEREGSSPNESKHGKKGKIKSTRRRK
jgi:hypothetical protein